MSMRYFTISGRILIFFLCCLYSGKLNAQKTDSLKAVLPTLTNEKDKVNTLIKIAEEYYQTGQRTEAIDYAKQSLVIAGKSNYFIGQGNALLIIGHAKLSKNQYDSALNIFKEAEAYFEKTNYTTGLIRTYTYMGQAFDVLAKYDQAIQILRKAQSIAEREPQPDKNRLANIHNSLGVSYLNKGSYELALDNDYKALHYAEAVGHKRLQAGVLNNIGVVSIRVYDYHKALDSFLKLLDLAREQNNPPLIALALSNVGDCYAHTGNFLKADQYLKEAIDARKKLDDRRGLAYTLSNLAYLRKQQQRWDESRRTYQQSIDLARTFDENEILLSPLTGLATVNIRLKNLNEAAKQIQEGTRIAKAIGSKLWERDMFLLSSQLDSAKGDFRNAYQSYKKYTALDDSLFTERKSLQVEEMKASYESEKKDQEIQLLNEVKKREELSHENKQRIYLIVTISFVVLIVLLLFWLKSKIRTASILKQQKKEVSDANEEMRSLIEKIEDQNESLAIKNDKLEDLHREKDGMIGIVAHDLRSPLNKVVGLTELITLTGTLNDEQTQMVARVKKVCEDGNSLIRDLMELHHLEDQADEDSIVSFEIKSTLRAWAANYGTQLTNKRLNLHLDLGSDSLLEIKANQFCITRVLDNILTNAIKFSPAEKSIFFTLRTELNMIKITIRDEGPGFQPQDMPHLFKKFKKLSARPTAGEHSTGLGLSIVKALVDKLKGEIIVSSFPEEGATFAISFPVAIADLSGNPTGTKINYKVKQVL